MTNTLALALENAPRRIILSGMAIWYAVVQLLYSFIGLDRGWGADAYISEIAWGWQFVDLTLLRERLAESLFYLHAQPPLFNLYLGLMVKAFPGRELVAIGLSYICAGFAFYLAVYFILRWMHVRRAVSLVLSSAFVAAPSFILLQSEFHYDFPVAALVAVTMALLLRFLEKPTTGRGGVFFLALFAVCATRSLFHLAFFVSVAALILVYRAGGIRTVLTSAAIPFLLLLAIYGKNYALYGKFTTSTWMGMNAAKVLYRSSSEAERNEWKHQGIVSEAMLIEPWSHLQDYPDSLGGDMRYPDVPMLHRPLKSGGYKNLHHIDYIGIADRYQRDAVRVYLHRPRAAVFGQLASWYCFFRSTAESIFLKRDQLGIVPEAVDYLLYGKSPWPVPFQKGYNLYIFLLVGLPLLFVYGLRVSLGAGARALAFGSRERCAVAILGFTILFVAVVINLFELAENQRARFYTDPFSLVLLGIFIENILRRRSMRGGHAPGRSTVATASE